MTISATESRISYSGNGVTTAFAFPYPFTADADLVVILVDADGTETTQTLTTHYTVTGAGSSSGSVTMLTAPSATQSLVIYREVDITQETDYITGDPFPAESHEAALDKLTQICQQLNRRQSRIVYLSDGSASDASLELPTPIANGVWLWSGDADEILTKVLDADEIVVTPAGDLTSTDVQSALEELQGDIDTAESDIATNTADIATNTADIATNTADIADLIGWKLIEEWTPTGVNSKDFTWDESSYSHITVVMEGIIPATDGDYLRARVGHTNGGTIFTGANEYTYGIKAGNVNGDTWNEDPNTGLANNIALTWNHSGVSYTGEEVGSDTGEGISGNLDVMAFNSTINPPIIQWDVSFLNSDGNLRYTKGHSVCVASGATTNAIDTLRLYWQTGNFEATGKVYLYGLRKS